MCAVGSLADRFNALKASFQRYLDDAAIRRELRAELAGLGGGDLERVLADIGVSREEMETVIENAPRSRMLLNSMLRRLDLGKRLGLMAPQVTRAIERRCATCGSQKQCGDWLAKGGPGDAYKTFCPNADAFDNIPRATGTV